MIDRVSPDQVVATCRDPQRAADLAAKGVQVRPADFNEPHTLNDAFEGATQILLVSSNARTYGGDPLSQHASVIEAAKTVGAKRVVYTSQIASSATSAFPPAHDHAATEQMLAASGLAWTALRNGFYAQSGMTMLGEAMKTGSLETMRDGKISWVGHDDLAEAAAAILMTEGKFEGPTPPLTGAEALDFRDLAELAAQIIGKPVTHTIIIEEKMRAKMAARNMPPGAIATVLGLYNAAHDGEFAELNPLLQDILGRVPTAMRELLASHK